MMEAIHSWVECILATVILIGIVEIIVPEGEIRRFVFLVTGVIASIIIATPVFKILSKDFNVDDVFNVESLEDNFFYIDTLRSTVDKQSEVLEDVFSNNVIREFNNTYYDMEISECKISFSYDSEGKIIEIEAVEVTPKYKVQDITLLKRRVASICEVDIKKVRVS